MFKNGNNILYECASHDPKTENNKGICLIFHLIPPTNLPKRGVAQRKKM